MDACFSDLDPFRSPQWRADRVTQLICSGPKPLPPRRYDDRYVRVYRKFMCEYSEAGSDEVRHESLALSMPDVHQAHLLHFGADRELRGILQARLLTRETVPEIARRFELATGTVETYEKLFFNVLDRLECKDWIAKVAIGKTGQGDTNPSGDITDGQRYRLYRSFGYYGGPRVLDEIIAAFLPQRASPAAEDCTQWLDDTLCQVIRSRAALAACAFDADPRDAIRWLKLWERERRGAAKSRAKQTSPPLDVSKNIEVFLAQFTDPTA